ncbi:efflux RND transporter periplasmic adaptor subunit [Rubellimicrobium roseum]|uniref:Efflux RND transporter periplasmic adaptor subunit n=1 Tax=Rubellimicrobium roseum TaxID=687525 RepID=A0A5C4NHV1_9RHOB|nr:efflux RND transporter periplasmic adaptor subunit [Rubellimicrobium roseum]TNC72616.1 efflux RND transporter periplasmic adaptor subunit [Rubellimicrobium roseum]
MAKDIVDTPAAEPAAKPDWALTRRERRAMERARGGRATRRRWPWVVLALLVVAAAAGVWLWRERQAAVPAEAPVAAAPEAPRAVQIDDDEWAVLEPETLRRTVRVIGTLQPYRRVDLSAETGGRVEEVAVRPGDAVTAGQVLVQVDVERLGLDVQLARSNADSTRAQLAVAEDQLQRQEALIERGVAAPTTAAELRASVAAQRASLAAQEDAIRSAELALEGATVRAPFDGVVSARSVEPGAVIGAGTPLLTVVDLTRMEMVGVAPVGAGATLSAGQAVELSVDGLGGQSFEGTVERIAPVAQEGTRALPVYVEVPNAGGPLLGGMFATGRIVVAEQPDALAVPQGAIREEGGPHVLVIEGDALVRRDVTPGEEWPGGRVQVEGLAPGDRVVTAALEGLEPGQPVELVEF